MIGKMSNSLGHQDIKIDVRSSMQGPSKYAYTAPKILLEILSGPSATMIIILTYAVFFIAFITDVYTTAESFQSENKVLLANQCNYANISTYSTIKDYGCSVNNIWSGLAVDLSNILSIQLDVQRNSINTSQQLIPSTITYDLNLWACYEVYGCGYSFSSNYGSSSWMKVISFQNRTVNLETSIDVNPLLFSSKTTLLPNIFQNQESTPLLGLIKSYFIQVEYNDDTFFSNSINNSFYQLLVLSRPNQFIRNVMTIILIVCTLIVSYFFINIIISENCGWLTEQKLCVAYFIAVLFAQNPIEIGMVFSNQTSAVSSYSAYIMDQLSQAILFVIWLAYADKIHRDIDRSIWKFYRMKVLFGIFIFTIGVFIITCQFPTISGDRENPVESVANWSDELKLAFCFFSILYIVLQWIWVLCWLYNIIAAHRALNKLPYMSTRYLQLSHRFFTTQSAAVVIFYLFQYITVIYFLSGRKGNSTLDRNSLTLQQSRSDALTILADDINTLFREQTSLFGKTFFLTTYAFVLAFLFTPATAMKSNISNFLTTTFVITEEELKAEMLSRKELESKQLINDSLNLATMGSVASNFIARNKLMKAILNNQPHHNEVFCLNLALIMRDLSFQAYYDPPGLKTESGGGDLFDIEDIGFDLLKVFYNTDHETFGYVAREKLNRRVFVVFRGTASQIQMKDNLNYGKRELDLFHCPISSTIDENDQLDPQNTYEPFLDATTLLAKMHNIYNLSEDNIEPQQFQNNTVESEDENEASNYSKIINTGAHIVEQGVNIVTSNVVGATNFTTKTIATGFEDLTAAAKTVVGVTPFEEVVKPFVHKGFWEAYLVIRDELHEFLRKELKNEPAEIFFTGHSLGGALATFGAIDFSIHSLPRLFHYFECERNLQRGISSIARLHVSMYNFGSPRLGNRAFSNIYNKIVPNSFRTVVDGDLVAGLPPSGYIHVGNVAIIDNIGSGTIIINPSFVERWLRVRTKASISAHSLLAYRKGLLGVIKASEYIMSYIVENPGHKLDFKSIMKAISMKIGLSPSKLGKYEVSENLEHLTVPIISSEDIIENENKISMDTIPEQSNHQDLTASSEEDQLHATSITAAKVLYFEFEESQSNLFKSLQ